MATTARYSHTAADAPRFDDTDMSGLPMFLRDLEIYLKDHGITSDKDKIAKAPLHTKYSRTRVLWEEMAILHKDAKWDEFVRILIDLYPEIAGQQSGTLAELNAICSEYRHLSDQDGARGNTFLRRFAPCILRLSRSNYKISNFEVCSRLAGVCTPQFLATLDMMLLGKSGNLEAPGKEGQTPPVRPNNTSIVDGGYRWEDIVATMREVWRRGFTAAQNAIGDAYPVASTKLSTSVSHGTSSPNDSDTRLVKLEQEFHEFAERATQGEKETKTAIRSLQTEVHTELAQGRTKADQNFAMIQETIQRLTNQLALNTTNVAPQSVGSRPNYPGPFNRPQNNYGGGQRNFPRPQYTCNWCGEIGHFMNNCPDCQNAIKSGEIMPDGAGGLRTKSGETIPRRNGPMDVPMRTKWQQLKAAVNKYVVAPVANFVGQYGETGMWGVPQQQPNVVLDSGMDAPPGWEEYTENLTPEQIAHYNNPPVGEMANASPDQEGPSQARPLPQNKNKSAYTAPAKPPNAKTTNSRPGPAPQTGPAHPYRSVPETRFIPIDQRPAALPVKPSEAPGEAGRAKPAAKVQAPIQTSVDSADVLEKLLSTKCPTTGITLREFLGVSPTLQDLLRKLLTRKREIDDNFGKVLRVALLTEAYQRKELGYAQGQRPSFDRVDESAGPEQVNWAELENEVITTTVELPSCAHSKVPIGSYVQIDARLEVYQSLPEKGRSDVIFAGEPSATLRTVWPNINNNGPDESILDSGSQIVSMSKDCARDRGASYDPTVTIRMQSANNQVNSTLGLARNIPFDFAGITVYLQCHISDTGAFRVLLGRPFDTLCESTYTNDRHGNQEVTITCPNTGNKVTMHTYARGVIPEHGEAALQIEMDENQGIIIRSVLRPQSARTFTQVNLQSAFLQASLNADQIKGQKDKTILNSFFQGAAAQPKGSTAPRPSNGLKSEINHQSSTFSMVDTTLERAAEALPKRSEEELAVLAGKKYKPVALKVRPVYGTVPEEFRIERHILGDPEQDMPQLPTHPPDFTPTGRYTVERREQSHKLHGKVLNSEEYKIFDWLISRLEFMSRRILPTALSGSA
ncbi:hypothetical protein K523DRAFT_344509 [Schizophyllum commune Tattone D]|nr:hypothetical protein K523DRAFT_344509 [Schizophyllum commune Tattone D]